MCKQRKGREHTSLSKSTSKRQLRWNKRLSQCRRGLHIERLEDRYPLDAGSLLPEISAAGFNLTTTASTSSVYTPGWQVAPGGLQPNTAESSSLINLDTFRADPRFVGIDGGGFSSVIIDTGIDLNHVFFGPDADFNGVADRIVYQYDFSGANDPDATDFDSHGSNVASIVGSQDGVIGGMAPATGIIALKVFTDDGSGIFGDVEEALQWVVANAATYNIASVNMSLGDTGNFNSPTSLFGLGDELAALAAQNVIVVSAAGNDYGFFQSQGVSYPAADPNSLAVGALWDANNGGSWDWSGGSTDFTTGADRLVSFTQRSTAMTEIFAPGALISGADAFGGVVSFAGTSQAAPHIAGIATLAQDLAAEVLGRRLTLAEFTMLLTDTASVIFDGDDEDDNVANSLQNYRRVDVLALGEAILALSVPGIDLTGTSFSVFPEDLLSAGGIVDTSFLVRNLGDTNSEAFNVKFYLSDDETIDPATDILLTISPADPHYNASNPSAYRVVGGLASQSSHAASLDLVVPSSNPFSTDSRHYLGMVVDPDGDVGEVNEGNNRNKGEGIDRQIVSYGSTVAAFPFFEDWESSTSFDAWWETFPGTEGRIEITSADGPFQGTHHVIMDDSVDDSAYSLNQLILHVDLAGELGVLLEFANKDFGDEEDPLDSIDVSVDGGLTWHQVVSLTGSNSTETYAERSYLLDNLGLVYSSDTLIRFQQYDNYGIPTDGMAFDNISLTSIYGSIAGQKWNDLDGDGIKDPDDPGLPGWTIYLDENFDGQYVTAGNIEPDLFDAGALLNTVFSDVTLTAIGGSSTDVYAGPPMGSFSSTGSLAFTRNGPFGWGSATRLRVDFDLLMNSVSLDAIADDEFDYGVLEAYDTANNLVGIYYTSGLSAGGVETMTVDRPTSDIAYVIASGSGGEVINLDNLRYEHTDRSTVTDSQGNYSFEHLEPGEYYVNEIQQPGWQQTSPSFGGYFVLVASGQDVTGIDFGNFALPGSISGRKWNDLDGNGVMDPGESGLAGWTIFVDENGNGTFEGGISTIASTDVPKSILDFTTAVSHIEVAGLDAITDLNLTLNITHTWVGDIQGYLISPAGTQVPLFLHVGGSGDNFLDTTFDDEALSPITFGSAPFAGSYQPQGLLANFDGQNPNGIWTLEISDRAGADQGSLNSWSLTIETGERSTITDVNGNYALLGLRPGRHTVAEVPQPGWVQTYPNLSLAGTRDNLNSNSAAIAALVPNRYDFFEGETGNNIFDGGGDMYDGGNFLSTNLASFIDYTNGVVTNGNLAFGVGSEYFTAKHQGLFVMGATNISIDSFTLSGNNGADGSGSVDGAVLSTTVNGQLYTIFVKRVYDAFDPSINEIIMVPGDGTGLSHSFSSNTNDGFHQVSGLSGMNEIYYALVSGAFGDYLSNADVLNIANEFLSNLATQSVHHVTILPGQDVFDIDFGNQPLPGEIHGQKWNDLDHDGSKDPGEPGLPGWTIYLDENQNGEYDVVSTIFEPDDYSAGTVLNNLIPGVTLSLDGNSLATISSQAGISSTGSRVFASSAAGVVWNQLNRLRATLDVPTAFVSIDAISDDSFDLATLEAYDSAGNLLESYTTPGLSTGQVGTMTIIRATADISYIIASGVSAQALNLDNLRFETSEAHTITDIGGNYSFVNLTPGHYVVREVPQVGWTQTFPVQASGTSIAVFDDPSFVDTSNTSDSESDNIQASLLAQGFTVDTFAGTSGVEWTNALAGADVLLIPELEFGTLHASLSPSAVIAVQEFVEAGGGLVINGAYLSSEAGSLLNLIFGWSVVEAGATETSFSRTGAVTGTEFADDAVSLPWNDGTNYLATSSLPPGALSLYDSGDQSVVAQMGVGSGHVIFLGYDWFDAAPVGAQDGGWLQVLESAILETHVLSMGGQHITVGPGEIVTDADIGNYLDTPTLSADFDGDGDVDGRDFLAWQRGFATPTATKADGDADGDADVDDDDLLEWQSSYGPVALSSALVATEAVEDSLNSFAAVSDSVQILVSAPSQLPATKLIYWTDSLVSQDLTVGGFIAASETDSGELVNLDEAFDQWDLPIAWDDDFGDIVTRRSSYNDLAEGFDFEEELLSVFED